jgi:outer membrane protein OmpA-like peptidoglycan-associated protein
MSFRIITFTTMALGAVVCASQADVRADSWLIAEVPAAVAVSEPQSSAFRTGLMPAVGAYTTNGMTALGLRMRAGALRDGPAPAGNLSDPGLGGLVTGGVAVRFVLRDGWIEGVAGGGFTGDDLVPVIEAGAGWSFAAGSFDIGPSLRYLRVVSRDAMATFGSADLVLLGLEVRFGKDRASRPASIAIVAAVPRAAPPPLAPAPVALERDPDRIVDSETSCEADPDGCEIAEHIFLKNDRIVLEERVMFDVDRARVRSQGRAMIGDIVRVWRTHPEWLRLTIEGHADVRGSDAYNLELSQHRAERVRSVFVELGMDPVRINAVGYGRSRPRAPGTTEAAYQLNRRVEFAIERELEVPAIGASR